jgi:hypothetical protein
MPLSWQREDLVKLGNFESVRVDVRNIMFVFGFPPQKL